MDHLNEGNLHPLRESTRSACFAHLFGGELRRIILNSTLLLAMVSIAPSAQAQIERATVLLDLSAPDLVQVTVKPNHPLRTWSFLNSYASAFRIFERVHNFRDDSHSAVKSVAAGVFRSDRDLRAVTYDVKLSLGRASDAAYVSWVTSDGGVLMLADLLPLEVIQAGPLDATMVLPNGWQVLPEISVSGDRAYLIEDPMNAVLSVGPSLRHNSKTVGGVRLDVVVSGVWSFGVGAAMEAATKVFKEYLALTRFKLVKRPAVLIVPMPSVKGAKTWQAQTRGSTLLLLINRNAKFENWIGQLKVIFTHELLHLWVPNALRLEGDYDWFFEGFTLYQALLTALDLKVISFDEYLNTLGRVYDTYLSQPDRLSLIEASEQRWIGATSAVYDKGMLVAFLYDLRLRTESQGKSTLSDRYAELFRKYASKTVDANEAIMSLLTSSPASAALLKSYVEERRRLELTETLKHHGIGLESEGVHTYLRISANPTKDQLRVLRSLGYRR